MSWIHNPPPGRLPAVKIMDIYRNEPIDLVPDACLPYEATWGYPKFDLSSPDAERLFAIIDDVHAHAGPTVRILRIRTGCTGSPA